MTDHFLFLIRQTEKE